MKRTILTLTIVILVLIVFVVGCREEESEPIPIRLGDIPTPTNETPELELESGFINPTRGIMEDVKYINEYMGFSISTPESLIVESGSNEIVLDYLEEIPDSFWINNEYWFEMSFYLNPYLSDDPYNTIIVELFYSKLPSSEIISTTDYINTLEPKITHDENTAFINELSKVDTRKIGNYSWYYVPSRVELNLGDGNIEVNYYTNFYNVSNGFLRIIRINIEHDNNSRLPLSFSVTNRR